MGSYQDGIFKFVMKIPENFPDGDCPVSNSLKVIIILNVSPSQTKPTKNETSFQ